MGLAPPPNPEIRPPSPPSDFRPPTSDFPPPISHLPSPTPHPPTPPPACRPPTSDFRPPTSHLPSPTSRSPIICPERRRRQAIAIVQVRPLRIIRPRVAHGDRLAHLVAPDHDGFALDLGIRPHELPVAAGDRE